MKTNKLWWSLLVILILPLSFALTACDDDDDDDKGNNSNSLSGTEWCGDADGSSYYVDFDNDGTFYINRIDYREYYSGDYSATSDVIQFSNISGTSNDLRAGSYEYEISGRKGEREMVIYDLFRGGGDLYLEEK